MCNLSKTPNVSSSRLRKQTNALENLQRESQRLRLTAIAAESENQKPLTSKRVPKEPWALVGYAEPELAFQSAAGPCVKAMRKHFAIVWHREVKSS